VKRRGEGRVRRRKRELISRNVDSTHHDINDENGNVTERRSSSSKVTERLMTRGVDDEESRDLVLVGSVL